MSNENRIEVINKDITEIEVDAIVNPTNSNLKGQSGLDKLIHKKCGKLLDFELERVNYCEVGSCVMTYAYNLPSDKIIHVVGPTWHGGHENESSLLYITYINLLELAIENGCKTIAIPPISTGHKKFPMRESALTAFFATNEILNKYSSEYIEKVYFICTNRDSFSEYVSVLDHYENITINLESKTLEKYERYYNKNTFLHTVKSKAEYFGAGIVYAIFLLYEAEESNEIKMKSKLRIMGVLGYFLAPIDIIPDKIPFIGRIDDFTIIIKEVNNIFKNLSERVIFKARRDTKNIFPRLNENIFDEVEKLITNNDSLYKFIEISKKFNMNYDY